MLKKIPDDKKISVRTIFSQNKTLEKIYKHKSPCNIIIEVKKLPAKKRKAKKKKRR